MTDSLIGQLLTAYTMNNLVRTCETMLTQVENIVCQSSPFSLGPTESAEQVFHAVTKQCVTSVVLSGAVSNVIHKIEAEEPDKTQYQDILVDLLAHQLRLLRKLENRDDATAYGRDIELILDSLPFQEDGTLIPIHWISRSSLTDQLMEIALSDSPTYKVLMPDLFTEEEETIQEFRNTCQWVEDQEENSLVVPVLSMMLAILIAESFFAETLQDTREYMKSLKQQEDNSEDLEELQNRLYMLATFVTSVYQLSKVGMLNQLNPDNPGVSFLEHFVESPLGRGILSGIKQKDNKLCKYLMRQLGSIALSFNQDAIDSEDIDEDLRAKIAGITLVERW